MQRLFLYFVYSILFFCISFYLFIPNSQFPKMLPDSVQSLELADTETPYRRAYYTNYTREEVVAFYQEVFSSTSLFGVNFHLPFKRLNYPPEDAQTLIRDQTKSTFLEEVVHPFRQSIYINGFKPSLDKDEIWYKGVHYEQKIIVVFNDSSPYIRFPIIMLSFFLFYILVIQLSDSVKKLYKVIF